MPFLVIYKNCYGLSIMKYFEGLTTQKYSYKICYGLSSRKLYKKKKKRGIRTRIVMVYLFLQQVLTGDTTLSYKNCYGLSFKHHAVRATVSMLSYKNCYGLSSFKLFMSQFSGSVIVQKLLWFIVTFYNSSYYHNKLSYKNCYGLSLVKSRFVYSV